MERVEADRTELLDGLRRGDAAAFDRVYARYRDRIYGFLRRLTGGDRPLTDDLFQETFLKLARAAEILGVRHDALRKRLERARAALQDTLDETMRPTRSKTMIGGGR